MTVTLIAHDGADRLCRRSVPAVGSVQGRVEDGLWPLVEAWLGMHAVAGLAVAVVGDKDVVARGFGVRDLRSGEPVRPETMFHLASVSKPFVATAAVSLTDFDLDAPITEWVPEFSLADGRAGEVTARGLLSHTSGLPDVSEFGWHEPRLGDDALSDLACSLSHWRLQSEPGSTYSYSNAGYELLGLLLSRVTGTTFEQAMRQRILEPLGMRQSTFLRAEVPQDLAASPHVGTPLRVPGDSYPYTRRHAPSSTLHSNLVEMGRWVQAHFEPYDGLGAGLVEVMSQPVIDVDDPPWDDAASLGWGLGSHGGDRVLSHSGADPGFQTRIAIVPERRTGVVVLANSNTVPTGLIAHAALDVVHGDEKGDGVAALRALKPAPASFDDLDDEGFEDAVWGAIELHRTDLVWPLLQSWTQQRPESSTAWTMTGWAHQVDGDPARARTLLERALELDPENDDAALILGGLSPG